MLRVVDLWCFYKAGVTLTDHSVPLMEAGVFYGCSQRLRDYRQKNIFTE